MSLGVSTSLKHRYQSLLLVLELLPHLNYIVAWVIILSLLKKLYPQFSSLSSLNCESCQYAKLHHVHLCLGVYKQSSTPFKLVYSNVWGPCPVMSPTGFKYFVSFVDDFSCVTWLYLMKTRSKLFLLILVPFVLKFKHNFMSLFKHYEVIIPNNICRNHFSSSCYNMGFSIRPRVLIHPLRLD